MFLSYQKRYFFSNKLKSKQRIGPHNLDVISLIVGSLLSKTLLEKRLKGLTIRINFVKCSNNVEYLIGFHLFLSIRGYCYLKKPKLSKNLSKGNKVLFILNINSYSFSNLIWLYNIFYRKSLKIIPRNLDIYITPLALATWFLSDIVLDKKSNKHSIFDICLEDLNYLSYILYLKYKINTVTDSTGSLYIKNTFLFARIIKPCLLPSLHYKLKRPEIKLSFNCT